MELEFRSVVPALLLASLLSAAVWSDVASRRIPNRLILCGILGSLLLQATVTPGAGFFSNPFGAIGLQQGAGGILVGLLMLLPMYALGAMGAGDVKLLAMIGGFLGPIDTLGAGLTSLVVGGMLSLVVALASGSLKRVVSNVKYIVIEGVLRAVSGGSPQMVLTAAHTGKLPYAVAIASGTTAYLILTRCASFTLY
jgi:prepilin peptidase CpaA